MSEPPEQPVTLVVQREVLPGHRRQFEECVRGIAEAGGRFEGHIDTTVFRPATDHSAEYKMVIRFDSMTNYQKWFESPQRKEWIDRIEAISRVVPKPTLLTGLESWFTTPGLSHQAPPPRHKMVLLTFLALYPTLLVVFSVAEILLPPMDVWTRLLITTPPVILLMTYGIMPLLTRLLRGWLYPMEPVPPAKKADQTTQSYTTD